MTPEEKDSIVTYLRLKGVWGTAKQELENLVSIYGREYTKECALALGLCVNKSWVKLAKKNPYPGGLFIKDPNHLLKLIPRNPNNEDNKRPS